MILGIFERNRGSIKADNTVLDENITYSLMAGISHSKKLPGSNMIGDLLHPLFQCETIVVQSGICTTHQYNMGYAELEERVIRY